MDVEARRPLRVLLADDHRLFVEALTALLDRDARIDIVGSAATGTEAVERVADLEPDVVLMDIAMPRGDGIEATRTITARHPATRVLILTGSERPDDIGRAREAGAVGYVSKKSLSSNVVDAIIEVAELIELGLGGTPVAAATPPS